MTKQSTEVGLKLRFGPIEGNTSLGERLVDASESCCVILITVEWAELMDGHDLSMCRRKVRVLQG